MSQNGREDEPPKPRSVGRSRGSRCKSFDSVQAAIHEKVHLDQAAQVAEPRGGEAASRTSLDSTGNSRTPRSAGAAEQGGSNRKSRSSVGSGPSQRKARKKPFKHEFVRFRVEGQPNSSASLMHKQASFSDVHKVTVVVPQTKLQERIQALNAREKARAARRQLAAPSLPLARRASGPERKDLLFSSADFWEELRAAVRERRDVCGQGAGSGSPLSVGCSRAAAGGGRQAGGAGPGAPPAAVLQAERARIERARAALPLLIQEVKGFRCAAHLKPWGALRLVTRLLDKVDVACASAFPTTHATGRVVAAADGCQAFKHSCGRTRAYGPGGWPQHVRSCSIFEPELTGGSLEDKSTFVGRIEALRCWQHAACLCLGVLAQFGMSEDGLGDGDSSPLHSSPPARIARRVRALVAALQPAMLAVHGLSHAEAPRELPLERVGKQSVQRGWASGGAKAPQSSSSTWLSQSSRMAAHKGSGAGKYLEKMKDMGLPSLSREGMQREVAATDACDEQAGGLAAQTELLLADLLRPADREEEGAWAQGWAKAMSCTGAAAAASAEAAEAAGQEGMDGKETSPLESILDVALGTLNSVLKAHMREGSPRRHPPWRVGADAGHSDGWRPAVDAPVGQDFADCLSLLQLANEVCDTVRPLVAAEETGAAGAAEAAAAGCGELVDWQVLGDLAQVCLEKGWAQGVASWPVSSRDDAADGRPARAGRRWAPDFAAVALLVHQVRSLFKQVPGESGVAVQEERLAARMCQLQTCLASDAVSRLDDAKRAFSENVEPGGDGASWSAASEAREPSKPPETTPCAQKRGEAARRQRLSHTLIGCERAVSSCRELLKLLALSLEYRLEHRALLPALKALCADGYVRLLPRARALRSTLAEPATGLVLASWGLVQSGDDEQAGERVRGMLRLSLSADATGHAGKLQGHILRIFHPKGCEETGRPGVGPSRPLTDLTAQADVVWKNRDPIYVDDLEELQGSWRGREESATDVEAPIADDAGSAFKCVMTVEKSSNVETEASLLERCLEQCVEDGGMARQVEFPVPNSHALREATRRLRTEIEGLEATSEALLVSLGHQWRLSELPDEALRVDQAPLGDMQTAADSTAHQRDAAASQLADGGGAAHAQHAHVRVQGRLARGFSRKQLGMIGAALRQQAPSMSEEQWRVWVSVYKALRQQRAPPAPAGGLEEEDAALIEHALDLYVAARSCRNSAPAPWNLVRLWVVSRLCCAPHLDISPPHDGSAEEVGSCRSTGVRAIRYPSDAIVGGGVRLVASRRADGVSSGVESTDVGGLEVETWLIKTRFSGSLSKPAPVCAGRLPPAETPGGNEGGRPTQESRRKAREEALERLDAALAKRLSLLFAVKGEQRESRHLQRADSDPQQHCEPGAGDDAAGRRGEEARQWYKEKLLGKGGFASVHRGFWYKAGGGVEFIAIKELDGKNASKDESVKKMAREANVMAMLKHTHLVRYYGHSETAKPYILMEYCPDGTLRSLALSCAQAHSLPCTIRILEEACKNPSFSPGKIQIVPLQDYGGPSWKRFVRSTACVYLRQILEGLRHMHERNMVHRDLKAENILLADHARCAKLTDFGETHAAAPGEHPDVIYTQGKTAGHCAPEFYWLNAEENFIRRAKNQAAHAHKYDVWALGCIAVELMTGHKPEEYVFESRGQSPQWLNPMSMQFLSRRMAVQCPEQLRLEYREHPVISELAERDKVVGFLDRCFPVDPQDRASAAELLEMGLMQQAKKFVMLPPG